MQKYPLLMLDHCSRLKECLDYFTFLPSNPASSIIQALCPLFQLSLDLQVGNLRVEDRVFSNNNTLVFSSCLRNAY